MPRPAWTDVRTAGVPGGSFRVVVPRPAVKTRPVTAIPGLSRAAGLDASFVERARGFLGSDSATGRSVATAAEGGRQC